MIFFCIFNVTYRFYLFSNFKNLKVIIIPSETNLTRWFEKSSHYLNQFHREQKLDSVRLSPLLRN